MEQLQEFWNGLDQRLLIFAITGSIAAILAGSLYQDRHMPKWMMAAYILSVGLMAGAGLSLFFPPLMGFTQYMRLSAFAIIALSHMIETRQSIPAKDATPEEIEDARRQKRHGILVMMGVFVIGMVAFPYITLLDKQEQGQTRQLRTDRTLYRNTGILLDIYDFIKDFRAKSERTDSLQQAQINLIIQEIKLMKQGPATRGNSPAKRVSYTATPIAPLAPVDTAMPVNLVDYVAVQLPPRRW